MAVTKHKAEEIESIGEDGLVLEFRAAMYAYYSYMSLSDLGINSSLKAVEKLRTGTLYVEPTFDKFFNDAVDVDDKDTQLKDVFRIEKLLHNQRLFLLGDPGIGKSALILQLCNRLTAYNQDFFKASNFRLPIPIILRELEFRDAKTLNWKKLWEQVWKQRMFDEFRKLENQAAIKKHIEGLLKKGYGLFMLDGLDEVADNDQRHALAFAVLEGMNTYKKSAWWLTSRLTGFNQKEFWTGKKDDHNRPDFYEKMTELSKAIPRAVHHTTEHLHIEDAPLVKQLQNILETIYGSDPPKFEEVYFAPFSTKQIERFMFKWYEAFETEEPNHKKLVERFMSDLDIHKDIKPLVRIPVMLNMAAIIHKVDSNFPDSKYQLYQHVSELYLSGKLERRRKMAAPPMSPQDQQYCMMRLGFEMQKRRSYEGSQSIILHYKEVKQHCIEALTEARIGKNADELEAYCAEYLKSLHKRSAILIPKRGNEADAEFAFMHLSYQDFYASWYIRNRFNFLTNSFSGATPEEAEAFWAELRELAWRHHWSETFILFLESFLIENTPFAGSICRKVFDKLEVHPDKHLRAPLLYKKVMINSFLVTRIYTEEEILGITELDLSHLELKELSRVLRFKNLEKLNFYRNQLTNFESLNLLSNLKRLDLDGNQLTDLKSLEGLKGLTELSLFDNQLTDLRPLEKLTNLNTLILYHNQLTDVTDLRPLEKLINLRCLNIGNNQITDLRPLEKLTGLTNLDLSQNQITDLRPLEKLTKLRGLYLSNNPNITQSEIQKLQSKLKGCKIRSSL